MWVIKKETIPNEHRHLSWRCFLLSSPARALDPTVQRKTHQETTFCLRFSLVRSLLHSTQILSALSSPRTPSQRFPAHVIGLKIIYLPHFQNNAFVDRFVVEKPKNQAPCFGIRSHLNDCCQDCSWNLRVSHNSHYRPWPNSSVGGTFRHQSVGTSTPYHCYVYQGSETMLPHPSASHPHTYDAKPRGLIRQDIFTFIPKEKSDDHSKPNVSKKK
ncbi:hypothetical protein AVEN_235438-1 [Araneus ventricosus]|uniref:Uncharacterized protein n=1 Tax=Araneus ventricosus TaxID=182803 RepID=A0A4Y2A3Y0_ARAVE|nr:hypothetical protein AVEN_235438-1 [Araneus ventricosus]